MFFLRCERGLQSSQGSTISWPLDEGQGVCIEKAPGGPFGCTKSNLTKFHNSKNNIFTEFFRIQGAFLIHGFSWSDFLSILLRRALTSILQMDMKDTEALWSYRTCPKSLIKWWNFGLNQSLSDSKSMLFPCHCVCQYDSCSCRWHAWGHVF